VKHTCQCQSSGGYRGGRGNEGAAHIGFPSLNGRH